MSHTDVIHAGKAIVNALEAHGVERAFLVPGESFLPVLDGLYDSSIEAIVCRHEGGASYMAEAHGKLTGKPGIAMVTRGPGAANAFVGIHTAWQDCTPMILFVGLIPVADRDRESFQEFDPKAWFGTQAKRVFVLDNPNRTNEIISEAFAVAQAGRPGPVVIGLPEDLLYQPYEGSEAVVRPVAQGAVSAQQREDIGRLLAEAKAPLFYVGGPGWTPEASATFASWAAQHGIPVVQDWRASDRIPMDAPANAGWLGYGRQDSVAQLLQEADLVITIGALLSDVPTDGYTLRTDLGLKTVVVSADTELLGHSGAVTMHVLATPAAFAAELGNIDAPQPDAQRLARMNDAHAAHVEFSTASPQNLRPTSEGTAHLDLVMAEMQKVVPDNAIYTFGAGNHCIWAQRYAKTLQFPSQLSVRNGSMGYSVPAAVAASLEEPGRLAVTIAGDGEFLMNGQEIATALQYGAPFLAIVVSNGEFGTIRDHQKNHFPDRVSGTQLVNPDFAAVAQGYGAHGELVTSDADIPGAFERALAAINERKVPALINVVIDQDLALPA